MADTLRNIGAQMANVMFNLAQRPGEALTGDVVATMDSLRKQWDAALASRPAEVDDEGMPALPEPFANWDPRYQGLELPVFTAEQFRQGQRDAVAADRAKVPVGELLAEIQSAIDTLDQTDLENRSYVPIVNALHHCRDAIKGDGFYGGYRAAPSHTTNKEK